MVDSIGKSSLPSAVQAVEKARASGASAKKITDPLVTDSKGLSFSEHVDQVSLSVEAVDLVEADGRANQQALELKSALQEDDTITLAPSNQNFEDLIK